MDYKKIIREIKNFPSEGKIYSDLSPLFADPQALQQAGLDMLQAVKNFDFDKVAAIDAQGFILGSILAHHLKKGLILIRKKGKFPPPVIEEKFALDFGYDALAIPDKLIVRGEKFLIVDDALASGKTAQSAARLIKKSGGIVACFLFLIEIEKLQGRKNLAKIPCRTLVTY